MKKCIRPRMRLWLTADNSKLAFGDGKWWLLCAIEKNQSLRLACEELGMSYRKGWGDLKKAEELFGFAIVKRTRGGAHGGKTILTVKGKEILNCYRKFINEMEKSLQKNFEKYLSVVIK